jgi:hypothetical protein
MIGVAFEEPTRSTYLRGMKNGNEDAWERRVTFRQNTLLYHDPLLLHITLRILYNL